MIGITCLKLSCEQAIYGDYRHQGQHPEMLSYQELTATSLILWENVDRIVQFWFKPSTNVLCGSFESFTLAGYECFQSLGKLGNCYDLMWSYFVSNVMKKLYICFYFSFFVWYHVSYLWQILLFFITNMITFTFHGFNASRTFTAWSVVVGFCGHYVSTSYSKNSCIIV